MTIQFACDGCDHDLRVPDASAGKKAKCPNCGAVQVIPAASTPESDSDFDDLELESPAPTAVPAFGSARASASAPFETGNPFQSPYESGERPFGSVEAGEMQIISVGPVFSLSWEALQNNFGKIFGVVALIVAGQFAVGLLVVVAATLGPVATIGMAIVGVLGLFVLYVGITRYLLAFLRGDSDRSGILFSAENIPLAFYWIVAAIIVGLCVAVGLVLLIVPGIIIGLMFSQVFYLILDKRAAPLDSFSMSKNLTDGNKWQLFAIFFLLILINQIAAFAGGIVSFNNPIAGIVIQLAIGLLLMPYLWIVPIVAYLLMSGQRVVTGARTTQHSFSPE